MTSQPNLEERLGLLEVESNDPGRLTARARVLQLQEGNRRRRLRGWLAAGGAAVLFALTPPGQSLADAVGNLVGVGDEPSGGPQFVNPGSTREDRVIAVGQAPSGEPFELVTTDPAKPAPGPGPEMDVTCVYTSFPELRPQSNLAQCLNAGVLRKLTEATTIHPAFTTIPGEPAMMVNAYATPDVQSLALVVDGVEVSMTSGLLEPVSSGQPEPLVRYGAGFVPAGTLDYARLRELAAPLEGVAQERPAIFDRDSRESAEAFQLLGGIEVVGFDADGTEVFRREVIGSSDDVLGVLIGLARPSHSDQAAASATTE